MTALLQIGIHLVSPFLDTDKQKNGFTGPKSFGASEKRAPGTIQNLGIPQEIVPFFGNFGLCWQFDTGNLCGSSNRNFWSTGMNAGPQ